MIDPFREFIEKEGLLLPSHKILLAVSGGVDSVVMAELFHRSGLKFAIAHCNFSLRGKESDDDEVFVAQLAEKYKVVFYSERFDTGRYAVEQKLSIQAAARQLRYDWFEEVAKKNKFDRIATAHQKNDVLETMLINLTRGTGLAGLHGIMPKQDKLIRPMLFVNREEIERFAQYLNLTFRNDSSNSSEKYVRNKIRMRVVPILKEINPSLENTAIFVSRNLYEAELIFKERIVQEKKRCLSQAKGNTLVHIKKLMELPAPRTFLYEFIREFGFNARQVEQVMERISEKAGQEFFSETHRLVKDREHLIVSIIRRKAESKKEYPIKKTLKKISQPVKLSFEVKKRTKDFSFPKGETVACLDFDKLEFPLTIRQWQPGDRFIPLGMQGQKKLSDFLVDSKVALPDKEATWLLVSAGKIAWVVGKRLDERFKVSPQTKKIYFVKLAQ